MRVKFEGRIKLKLARVWYVSIADSGSWFLVNCEFMARELQPLSTIDRRYTFQSMEQIQDNLANVLSYNTYA